MNFKKLSIVLVVGVFMAFLTTKMIAGVNLSEQGLKHGAWVGVQPNKTDIAAFQVLQKRNLDTVMCYVDWTTEISSIQAGYFDSIYGNNSTAIMTWEAWGLTNSDISSGKKDDYIIRSANTIKSYGKEIWINLFHEANGNWYDWGLGDSKTNTNDTYKAAYKHVVDVFKKQGVSNVKWVYTINCDNVGTNASYLGHYPGDNYVDYISIDGYNWGTTQSWGSTWKSFDQIFKNAYNALSSINKPMLITEVASAEIGGDKAAWITDAFKTINSSYPRIKLVSWFSHNKETDWRINSSEAALDAYIKAINGSNPTTTPTITTTTTTTQLKGDVNGDKRINSTDVAMVIRYVLGGTEFTEQQKQSADINNDSRINTTDASLVERYVLGIINELK